MSPAVIGRALAGLRSMDRFVARRRDSRRILVDGRTPVNYTMFAPVHAVMRSDPRVAFHFTASEEPGRAMEIYGGTAAEPGIVSPREAALRRYDAYVTSDFMWAPLLRGSCRIQIFHGVAGKYGFDAPVESMRAWGRLFFVNERRLRNFIAAGALDAGSRAAVLVGMPKLDGLVDGSLERGAVLAGLGLDPDRPTVLYAPTWSPASSLNLFGVELVRRLARLPVNLVVKLHDRSRDPRPAYSGGGNWAARIESLLPASRGHLAAGPDISRYLAAADLMITDHSSAGFEYLLLDRPLVRIHLPALLERARVHPEYVRLLSEASVTAHGAAETVSAVERGLSAPGEQSAERRAVARDLFYRPGTATRRAVAALYEAIELEPPAARPAEAA